MTAIQERQTKNSSSNDRFRLFDEAINLDAYRFGLAGLTRRLSFGKHADPLMTVLTALAKNSIQTAQTPTIPKTSTTFLALSQRLLEAAKGEFLLRQEQLDAFSRDGGVHPLDVPMPPSHISLMFVAAMANDVEFMQMLFDAGATRLA
jgi:hypothetical protein